MMSSPYIEDPGRVSPVSSAPTPLTPISVTTGSHTMMPGEFVPIDASVGPATIDLPTAPPDNTQVGFKIIAQATPPNNVTFNRGGTDVFNRTGGNTSLIVSALLTSGVLQYQAATGIWYVLSLGTPTATAGGAASLDVNAKIPLAQVPQLPGLIYAKKDYGAVGDGVTDDHGALQNAINAAAALKTYVAVEPGDFKSSAQLDLTGECMGIIGSGSRTPDSNSGTVIWCSTELGVDFLNTAPNSTPVRQRFADFTLRGPTDETTLGTAMGTTTGLSARDYLTTERVFIHGFKRGLAIDGDHNVTREVDIQYCYDGVYFKAGSTIGNNKWTAVRQLRNTRSCFACAQGTFIQDDFDEVHCNEVPYGFYKEAGGTVGENFLIDVNLDSVYFEAIGNGCIYDAGNVSLNRQVTITNGQHIGPFPFTTYKIASATANYAVQVYKMQGWSIRGGDVFQLPGALGIYKADTITHFDHDDISAAITNLAAAPTSRYMTVVNATLGVEVSASVAGNDRWFGKVYVNSGSTINVGDVVEATGPYATGRQFTATAANPVVGIAVTPGTGSNDCVIVAERGTALVNTAAGAALSAGTRVTPISGGTVVPLSDPSSPSLGFVAQTEAGGAVHQALMRIRYTAAPMGVAPIASPAFTGTPTAPTPSAGDNTTRLATTAFVQAAAPASVPYTSVIEYGGKADGKIVTDGAMTPGQSQLSSTAAGFTSTDAGKLISVENAATFTATANTHSSNVIDTFTGVTLNGVVFSPVWQIRVGAAVTGSGVPSNTTVTAILSPTSIQISNPTTSSLTATTLTFSTSLATTISSVAGGVATLGAAATNANGVTGAKVTFGTDDRPAIQAAINAANGGTVFYPDGIYLTNVYPSATATPLTIVDGTTFLGASRAAILRFWPEVAPVIGAGTGYLRFMVLSGSQSFTMQNMTMQGPDVYGYASGPAFLTGIDHTNTSGTTRLINCAVKRFNYGIRKSPGAADSVNIEAIDSRLEGCAGNPAGSPILAPSTGTGSAGKRVKLRNVEISNFGWIGSNQYHGMYIYTDHDVDSSGVTFTNQFGTGMCCQVYDSSVSLANAAQTCSFNDIVIAPSCPGGGIFSSYNCQTVIDNAWFLGGNNALYLAGPVKVTGSVFNGVSSNNYQVQTAAGGQTTGLPIIASFDGCAFGGSAFSFIDIFQVGQLSSEITVSDSYFGGSTNDSCIFQESHTAAGTNTSRVTVQGSTFEGTNLCVHSHGGTGSNSTIVELKDNDFLTTGSFNRALTVSVNPATRVNLHGNNFSTGDTPIALNSAVGVVDSAGNYGTNWNNRTPVSANYTVTQYDELIAYTATAAAYTVTPPSASSVPAGKQLTIKDESGAASTHPITIGGTIDGTTQVINSNFGALTIYSDATSWHAKYPIDNSAIVFAVALGGSS